MKPRASYRFTLGLDCDGRIVRRCLRGVRCSARGCKLDANGCWLPDDGDQPSEWYCYGHMHEHGYCPGCGNFWAGIESFDFSRTGYCENCASEFEEHDDWDDDWAEWDDMPPQRSVGRSHDELLQ